MPIVRYRTGDYVRLANPKEDGELEFFWPTAKDVVGREHEFLISSSGRRISLTAFNMHNSIFDNLFSVQFYQAAPGHVEFRYVPNSQFDSSRLKNIETGVKQKLGDDFNIELRQVAETEKTARGKHRWLVNNIDK